MLESKSAIRNVDAFGRALDQATHKGAKGMQDFGSASKGGTDTAKRGMDGVASAARGVSNEVANLIRRTDRACGGQGNRRRHRGTVQ